MVIASLKKEDVETARQSEELREKGERKDAGQQEKFKPEIDLKLKGKYFKYNKIGLVSALLHLCDC